MPKKGASPRVAGRFVPVFLFWNVGKNSLSKHLGEATRKHQVDLAILAECQELGPDIVRELNSRHPQQPYWEFTGGVSSLRFFTRLPAQSIHAISDDGRASLRSITPPLGPGILIAAAHLRSKLWADDFDQHFAAMAFNRLIIEAEQKVGHKRTLVIGDLNMDPFDPGMMAANGLHAVMDKMTARKVNRIVQGESYEFFYMWSRMGNEFKDHRVPITTIAAERRLTVSGVPSIRNSSDLDEGTSHCSYSGD